MPEVRLIDAIELVRYLCGACPSHQNGECIDKMCWKYEDRARIENAPTIEAQPVRHGRWDEIQCFSEHGIEMASYECTSCGNDIERQRGLVPPYCEFCGAKMDGGAEQ